MKSVPNEEKKSFFFFFWKFKKNKTLITDALDAKKVVLEEVALKKIGKWKNRCNKI